MLFNKIARTCKNFSWRILIIKREEYLKKIIDRMNNGMIKIITGIRRCGKYYLLFEIFYNYLIENGVDESHIITLQLDDRINLKYRDPDVLCEYIHSKIIDNKNYYILLDEVQFVKDFEDAWNEYSMYGGMPYLLMCKSDEQKINYLNSLFNETSIKDIIERNNIKNIDVLEDILNIIPSSVGSLTNPNKLSDAFKLMKKQNIALNTIKQYLDYCIDSFLIRKAYRYDVKGKNYIETPLKYYFSDIGLRNARLGFRQQEENYIMKNIIYNELIIRGFNVDVGVVTTNEKNENNNYVRKQLEVDFICNLGYERYYIQSALNIDSIEKREQEEKSLININDSFKKIIIVRNNIKKWKDDKGVFFRIKRFFNKSRFNKRLIIINLIFFSIFLKFIND